MVIIAKIKNFIMFMPIMTEIMIIMLMVIIIKNIIMVKILIIVKLKRKFIGKRPMIVYLVCLIIIIFVIFLPLNSIQHLKIKPLVKYIIFFKNAIS